MREEKGRDREEEREEKGRDREEEREKERGLKKCQFQYYLAN